jgi:hypothetical protein
MAGQISLHQANRRKRLCGKGFFCAGSTEALSKLQRDREWLGEVLQGSFGEIEGNQTLRFGATCRLPSTIYPTGPNGLD